METRTDLKGLGIWREGRNLVSPASYHGQHKALVKNLVLRAERDGRLPFAFIRGPEGCGKEDLVLALAQGLSARVLECEAEELLAFAGDWGEWLKVLERDLRLRTGFVWIRHAEAWLMPGEAARAKLRQLGVFLRERSNLNLIMTAERGPAEIALPSGPRADGIGLGRSGFESAAGALARRNRPR